MATIKHYLKTKGNDSFKKTPFNVIDVAVLTALSYANFIDTTYYREIQNDELLDLSVFGKSNIIKILQQRYLTIGRGYKEFLELFFKSPRYKNLKVGYFKDDFSIKDSIQFFALTFLIDGKWVICYRGTDNTLNGFKEDMLMTLYDKVGAQILAKNYAKEVIGKIKGKVILTGHSKGGNLSYYTFFNLSKKDKSRIDYVYNFDGPGFKNDSYDYETYKSKIIKIVPQDCIVGILFDSSSNFEIVTSNNISVASHDLLTWNLDRKKDYLDFNKTPFLTTYSKSLQDTFNPWVKKYSNEEVQDFLDFIFAVCKSNKALTLGALLKDFLFSNDKYVSTIKTYDEEKKTKVKGMVREFFKLYLKNLLKNK